MSRDYFLTSMQLVSERAALVRQGESCSYGNLLTSISDALAAIKAAGIENGDAVILNADYNFASISTLLALYLNRNIVAPLVDLNEISATTLREHAHCSYRLHFSGGHLNIEKLQRANDSRPLPLYQALKNSGHAGLVLLSSGSTGMPKAILHNFDELIAAKLNRVNKKPTMILMFLLFDHIGGINSLLNTLIIGGCAVLPVERTPEKICILIERYKVKVLPVSPTFLNLILVGQHHNQHDLSSVRLITYGTETMQESLLQRVHKAFPRAKLLQTFGTSETGISTTQSQSSTSTFFKLDDKGTEYRIVDGALQLKTQSQFVGYLNYDNDNVTDDGWFMTGDLVEQNNDGFIRITGRSKEVVNVGGEKVLPLEIENILLTSELVEDCLVYGVPNAITGQCVHVDVKASAISDKRELKTYVLTYLRGRVDEYKLPVKVNKVDDIAFTNRFKKSRVYK